MTGDIAPECDHTTCSGKWVDSMFEEEWPCHCICHGPTLWERLRARVGVYLARRRLH